MSPSEDAKKRLTAALDESRRIEKEIDLREQRKDQEDTERLIEGLTAQKTP